MAVIGAGPAGSVCACSALATSDRIRVALIERERFPRDKSCGDAVRSDAASALRELGLGAVFDGRPEIRRLRTTYPPRFGYLGKIANWNGYGYYIVERKVFDHRLFDGAMDQGVRGYLGYKLTNAEFDESSELWNLELKAQRGTNIEIRCRVLVGADGTGSRVRRLAGLRLNEDRHTAVGLRAYAQAEGLDDEAIRIDWLENLVPGYGWTFPLAHGKVNIGVGIDKRDFKRSGTGLESYLDEYVRYLSSQGVAIRNLGDLKAHPLPLASQAPPLVPHRRMALVGDAAAMIDPFTGEGIHYGIWAGRLLGSIVGEWVNRGGDLQAGLERYAKTYAEQFGESVNMSQWMREMIQFYKYFG